MGSHKHSLLGKEGDGSSYGVVVEVGRQNSTPRQDNFLEVECKGDTYLFHRCST